jgi:hypothetical protein
LPSILPTEFMLLLSFFSSALDSPILPSIPCFISARQPYSWRWFTT